MPLCHICVDKRKTPPYPDLMASVKTWQEDIDAKGLLCPLPVLKARKRLKSMAPGTVLRLVADDPAAVIDVPHFCAESGCRLIAVDAVDEQTRVYFIENTDPER